MRTITTTSAGTAIELDGDVLAVIEAISRDLTRRHELELRVRGSRARIPAPDRAADEDDLRTYLQESLFMSFNRFENERMTAWSGRRSAATDDEG